MVDVNTDSRPAMTLQKVALPVVQWYQAYSDGAATAGEMVSRFMHEQTQRNVEAMLTMTSQAANPGRLLEAHEQWLAASVRGVAENHQRLMSLGSKVARDCFEAGKAAR